MDRAANIKNDTPREEGAGFIDWFAAIGREGLVRYHSQSDQPRKFTMLHVFQQNLQPVSLTHHPSRARAHDVVGIPGQYSSSPVPIVANSVLCATTW